MTLFEYDSAVRNDFSVVCGIDEAGRGPLAGDVYAAAVIFDEDVFIDGLNDSKKLTEKKREKLFDEIISKAKAYCVATASVEEIEEINILQATFLAMKRAYEGLGIAADIALIDGNQFPKLDCKMETVVKGDSLSASIAAASILAKVSRDRYMTELAEKYPEYRFEKHKGYGTKLHKELILEHGTCPVHRMSFLKKLLKNG
ncbi:MAG: ribonuclease HII [Oscillospiraceae bacterium]|nr:ribonuclease HII [Oscillospiraceae bacterium]